MNASKAPHPVGAVSRQGEVETPPPARKDTSAVTAASCPPEEATDPRSAFRCLSCGHQDVFHNLSTDHTRRTACSWHDAPEGPCPCKTFTPRTEADPS